MGMLKDYFSFSKRERTGAIVLVIVIAVVFVLPDFLPSPERITDRSSFDELKKQLDSMKEKEPGAVKETYRGQKVEEFSDHFSIPTTPHSRELFYFDPNTLSAEGWKKLGLTDRTIQTIRKYISRGGSFRQPQDLAKIYSLRKSDFEQLMPFVRIQQKNEQQTEKIYGGSIKSTKSNQLSTQEIDVNKADTTMMIALPGIGSKLATRILRFREKLGGFYSVDQLGEVYGLQDSVFQKIKPFLSCDNPDLQRININTADLSILKSHPYIKPEVANAIVNYRKQHGEYQSVEELKKIEILSPATFQKIQSYLSVR